MAASAAWTTQVELDYRGCLTLEQVLRAFVAPISEYHAWALIHQTVQCLLGVLDTTDMASSKYMAESRRDIVIHKEGFIHTDTFLFPGLARKELTSELNVMGELGMVVYEALDYTMPDDMQRKLGKNLEMMLETMTDVDSGDEGDEGIEDCELGRDLMRKVVDLCRKNVEVESKAGEHYAGVCRALVVEALEISSFMAKVRGNQASSEELIELDHQDWSSIWQQLMKELRNGIQLKKVDYSKNATEFELTPYELLMDDIRTRKWKLNPVKIPPTVRKDAEQEILEFIRSRPPLKSVSLRVLKPKQISQSPGEKLMQDIRSGSARKSLRKAETKVSDIREALNPARTGSERIVIDLDDEIVSDLLNFDMDDVSICDISVFSSCNVEMRDVDITPAKDIQTIELDITATKARALMKSISDAKMLRPPLNRSSASAWNQGLPSSLLTFEEFRQVVVKMDEASLECLPTLAAREDLKNGKLCFRCKTTRFGIFTWATECFTCARFVCSKCLTSILTQPSDLRDVPLSSFVTVNSGNWSPSKNPTKGNSRHNFKQKCNENISHGSHEGQTREQCTPKLSNSKSGSGKSNGSAEKCKISSAPRLVLPSFKRSKTMSKAETRKSKMKLAINCGIKQRVCKTCLEMMTDVVTNETFSHNSNCSEVREHLI